MEEKMFSDIDIERIKQEVSNYSKMTRDEIVADILKASVKPTRAELAPKLIARGILSDAKAQGQPVTDSFCSHWLANIKRMAITKEIETVTGRSPALDVDALYLKGIHGIDHALSVQGLTRKLAKLEEMPEDDARLLSFCALFHDIGRRDNTANTGHGAASVEILRKNDFFGFSGNRPLAEYIITCHCLDDKTAFQNVAEYDAPDAERAVYLLKAFKDCDNLDRFRIHDFDPSYLRLPNSHKLIETARQFNGQ
jgi:putative nucleotidyltransferase with HDIG domain